MIGRAKLLLIRGSAKSRLPVFRLRRGGHALLLPLARLDFLPAVVEPPVLLGLLADLGGEHIVVPLGEVLDAFGFGRVLSRIDHAAQADAKVHRPVAASASD